MLERTVTGDGKIDDQLLPVICIVECLIARTD